nr:hypothetical protein [Tanacetum cinerariifolium]
MFITIYEPPPPHIMMNIYNEEKVRKPSQVHEAGKSVGYATTAACLVISISMTLNDKIRFRVQSHRRCYTVYTFYALAIATLMVVVMLT